MMTLTFLLLAANIFCLLRRKSRWGPIVALVSLVIGIVIFVGDVDFAANLGIQR
jgi:hypothetical protein